MSCVATIIFCDITGYSKNDDDLQAHLVRRLSAEVTRELYHRLSEPDPSTIFLPTGDGIAIALIERDTLTVRSSKMEAFQLLDALMRFAVSSQPAPGKGGLRIGIHRGPVVLIRDINRQLNVCGYAVNYCQRVMDAARPNQVLFSEDAYQSLVGEFPAYGGEPFADGVPAKFSAPISVPAKHGLMLHVRVMFRDGNKGWEQAEPFLDGAINGKIERTKFIISRLSEMVKQPERPLVIYEQSAFTTFGMTDRTEGDGTSPEYRKLALEQKRLLESLTVRKQTQLYLLIRPVRAYNIEWRKERMDTLLGWLRKATARARSNVRFAVTDDYEGPNRLIVQDLFCIEGYKIHDTSGYELSFVKTSWNDIRDAVASFRRIFDKCHQSKATVLADLQKKRRALINRSERSDRKKRRHV